jgi:outer membrane protein assembly factor BamB
MSPSVIFAGMHGRAFCLDRMSGQIVWSTNLKGSDFVTLLLDGDLLLAATHGEVFGLQAATGKILWHNEMPGQGLGLVSFATTAGASSPGPAAEELARQAAAAAAATSG